MSSGKSRILITGAGGIVGSGIRPYLAEQFDEIVLLDIKPIADTAANETAILGSANDPACIRDAIAGVDGVVHLAPHRQQRPSGGRRTPHPHVDEL
jgi:uronate dehydrogenase